jgi:hypothetical protein
MKKSITLLVPMLLFCATAWAGEKVGDVEKPSMFASETVVVTAEVAAIDHETREVTLRQENGATRTFVVGEEARNLDQVVVGDIVTAEYYESISIEVFAGDGSEPGAGEIVATDRSELGAMPFGAVMDSVVIMAVVEAIDLENNTFKLKYPSGEIKQYTALDPENLKKGAVGDNVVITITEAMAISVEHAAKE